MTKENSTASSGNKPSVNERANLLVAQLISNAEALQLGISKHESGCTIVDAGINSALVVRKQGV